LKPCRRSAAINPAVIVVFPTLDAAAATTIRGIPPTTVTARS
jgi:hypothetical protein